MSRSPHRFAIIAAGWLLRRTVPADAVAVLLGDLLEEFQEHGSHTQFVSQVLSVAVHSAATAILSPRASGPPERPPSWTAC